MNLRQLNLVTLENQKKVKTMENKGDNIYKFAMRKVEIKRGEFDHLFEEMDMLLKEEEEKKEKAKAEEEAKWQEQEEELQSLLKKDGQTEEEVSKEMKDSIVSLFKKD